MRTEHGFTLIELLVVVVVAAILLTVGVPPMRDMVQNNRITAQANDLLTAMTLARSEAIKLRTRVTVCASTDQSTCSLDADWATGWIVATDDEPAGDPDPAQVLRVWGAPAGNPSLTAVDPGGADLSFVRFLPNGTVQTAAIFTHTIPGCTGTQQRTITVAATGQSRVTRTACPT